MGQGHTVCNTSDHGRAGATRVQPPRRGWGTPTRHPPSATRMAADTPAASQAANDDEDAHWARAEILERAPHTDGLTDNQQAGLAAAIRNPDAPLRYIENEIVGATRTIDNLLWRYESDNFDDDTGYADVLKTGAWTFRQRTPKQRAVIDFLARHPSAYGDYTVERVAELITEELGVHVHPTTPYKVRDEYSSQITKRRKQYDKGAITPPPTAVDDPDDDVGGDTPRDERTLRERLEAAGFTELPSTNLDDMPTTAERKRAAGGRSGSRGGTSTPSDSDDDSDDVDGADSGERVRVSRDGRSYEGPPLDLTGTGGRTPSLLVDADRPSDSDAATGAVGNAIARAREEDGAFGEQAYTRSVTIKDKDALEDEIRRLRLIVSSQGAILKALRDTLDNLTVDVSLSYSPPNTQTAVDPNTNGERANTDANTSADGGDADE